MSKHTPEPWRVGRDGSVVSDTPVPLMRGSDAIEYYGGHLIGESITEPNARRIVACVNACAGFEVETLESIAMTGETLLARFEMMKSENEQLKKQRDELLAALSGASEKMKAAHESMFDQCLSNPVYNAWGKEINVSAINELQLEASLADAAIAKAKGGAA